MQDTQIIIDLLVKQAEESARKLDSVTAALGRLEAASKRVDGANRSTSASADKNASSQGNLAKTTDTVASATDRAGRSQKNFVGHIAKTTVLSAGINQLFLQMVDVTGQAIQNVDLMNNFPATMASMGQSTERAGVAFQALRDYVGQIGGNLGDATSYVTRFTGATGDVKAATAIFVGLNNALIAGDSSLEEQRGAMLQFAQALERGKIEAKEWNILTQNMSFQLNQVAQSMGYVSSAALREAMVEGEVSMSQFTVALTKMSTGTGNIVTQAEARMNGMQFAFNRMKNTVVQGLAAIIDAIGRQNIVSFFSFLTQVVQVLTSVVLKLISALVTLFNFFGRLFGLPAIKLQKDTEGIADGIGAGAENAGDLKDGLDDAGDSAKKLNKSLASFDKMNVLPDKESGGGKDKKDDAGGGAGAFDAGQLGELGDLFDGIGGGLEEAGKWAKIFAGILVGLAGIKFAQGIINQVDGIVKSFQTAQKGIGSFGKTLFGTADDTGKKVGGLQQKLQGLPVVVATSTKNMGKSLTGFLDSFKLGMMGVTGESGIAGLFNKAGAGFKFLLSPIGLVITAIAAVVAGIIYLYNTNEDFKKGFDSVWKGAGDVLKEFVGIIKSIIEPALDGLKKAWKDLQEAIKPITVFLQPLIIKFKEWWKALFPAITGMELLGKIIGTVAKVIAIAVVGPIAALIVGLTLVATAIIWLITKLVEIGTAIVTYITDNFGGALSAISNFITGGIDLLVGAFTTAKDGIVGFVTGGIDLISGAFTTAKDAIVTFITEGIDFVGEKFTEFAGWIEDHKTHLINWGIVITTILLPKIVQIGAQFAVVAAQAVAEFAKMVASSVASAASTAAAWVTQELPKIIKGFATMSKKAAVEFAKTTASAVVNAGKTAAAWAVVSAKAVIEFVKVSASAYKQFAIASAQAAIHGAKIAASFVASAVKAGIQFGIMVVQFVAGLATMAAQLAIKAVQMAISWALALGPIGLAIAVVAGAIALIIANWDVVKEVAIATFEKVKEVIQGAIDWVKANWPLILAIITGPIGLAVLAIVKNWDTIKEAFQAALDFVKQIWNTVIDFFKGVWDGIKLVFAFVVDFYKGIFQGAWDAVKFIWNAVKGFFSDRWNDIKNVFSTVNSWITDKFRAAWDGITSVFSNVSNWFRVNVVDKIVNAFNGIKDRITGFFSGVWDGLANGLKNALNTLLNLPLKIPSVTVAGKTIGGQTLIPRLARGGIIDQATLAVVGESGAEAVVPLENNLEWIDKLAAKINASTGGSAQPIQLTVQIGEEKIATQIIDLINEKTHMSGRNTIYV